MKESLLDHLFQEELYHFTTPVVVVLARPWETCTQEEQMLLQKILTSVRIDLNTVRLVATPSVRLDTLDIYSPARVLMFGCTPDQDIPLYQETTAQGFTVIRADDLGELDEQKKKNLWVALRRMFGI